MSTHKFHLLLDIDFLQYRWHIYSRIFLDFLFFLLKQKMDVSYGYLQISWVIEEIPPFLLIDIPLLQNWLGRNFIKLWFA